ncbi:DUF4011 domain-containing protein [Nesterenkonia sp.]|uniref:DUF4011 domain-containing protein n=1 Tax=Nesterenkonia sp. TaxID=704201 RepID=UPI00260C39E3|nr:DUF4011 domain-containing protein [Nesterenkonia sp.]
MTDRTSAASAESPVHEDFEPAEQDRSESARAGADSAASPGTPASGESASSPSPSSPDSADSPSSPGSAASPAAAPAADSAENPDTADVQDSQHTTAPVLSWVESLGTGTENDTMLRFTPSQHNAIDLTEANASGLMQLLGGRRTRLSTLLNEPGAFEAGARAAANIRAKVREMREERGIEVGYLAAGIASWTETSDAGSSVYTAPLMLIPISLRTRSDTYDYELQFTAAAGLNPALQRHLSTHHGVTLDSLEFHQAGYATARFDAARTAELMTRIAAGVAEVDADSPLASLQVWKQLYVSTFADLADLGNPQALNTEHPVLKHLASSEPLDQTEALSTCAQLEPLDERAPGQERLVTDADTDQQAALDAILSGVSAVVSTPPGSGQTQTAVNAAAGLAWQGKRVLVIAERADTLAEFSARLSAAKVGTLAVHVPAQAAPEQLRSQVIRAIKRAERAEPPRLGSVHKRLTEARHQLRDHVASLHKVRQRWKCSPYQAMQALAALTSLNPAPGTSVRLKRSVLDNTVDRSQVSVKLKRIAELGEFSETTRRSPWFGAQLSNRQETNDAHALVKRLREELPDCWEKIRTACEQVEVTPGSSFADWHAQMLLFQRVQESLGRFSHDVYARDVDDLIAATAPGWWRRQNNVEMSSMARSRLRRVAKEYIRPGVSINDLHASLLDVQSEREEWMKWTSESQNSLPKVPRNLDRLVNHIGEVQSRLDKLVAVLRPLQDGRTLYDLPVEELMQVVETLAEDERSLHTLPERTLLAEQLREQGFGELLDDFARRQVPAAQVADELELAWWQSALEAMISGDEYLAMTTGENLRSIEETFRSADAAHIESGAQRLSHTLAVRWKSAIEEHPEAAAHLRSLLRDAAPTVQALESVAREITQPLVPIWTTSPLGLAAQFPSGPQTPPSFDTVLLLDAETLAVPAALGAVSRAEQVVAFGDPVSGAPKLMTVSADPIAREAEAQVPESVYSQLARILPEYRLRHIHRGVDQELTELISEALYEGQLLRLPDAAQLTGQGRRLSLQAVTEGSGREPVESPTAEVNRVVDLVFEHVRSHRNRSLAVITGSEWHAKRVADAIRVHLANHPWAVPFFEHGAAGVPGGSGAGAAGVGTGERFVVAPVERAHGVVRDDVIFSLGFGTSVKGEAAHEMGELSGPRGTEYFAQAVTRARGRLTLVSSVQAADLDPARLQSGALLVRDLLRLAAGESSNPSASPEVTDPLVLDLVDRIRARGGRVEDGFRGTLDLAACPRRAAAESQVKPVAMVSDGTSRYAELSVRERSRLRPERFTQLGWQFLVLWTIEVFTDPRGTTERVAELVGLGEGPEFAQGGRGQLSGSTGPVRFGGAADAADEDAHRRNKQWPAPQQRRWKSE